jgi:hypothetical protein
MDKVQKHNSFNIYDILWRVSSILLTADKIP